MCFIFKKKKDKTKSTYIKRDKLTMNWLKIIGASSIAMVIILLLSIVAMFAFAICANCTNQKTSSNTENSKHYFIDNNAIKYSELRIDAMSYSNLRDSMMMDKFINDLSNKHNLILNRCQVINSKCENLTNDIRQETNNNLTKLNLWLSFWIGIIALFGVLAPLVAEYRYKTMNRKVLDDLKKEGENALKRYKLYMSNVELESAVNALVLSHDNRIVSSFTGDKNSRKIIDTILYSTLNSLKLFLIEIDPEKNIRFHTELKDFCEIKAIILQVLISLYAFIQKLKYIHYKSRIRDINNLQEKLKTLITNMVNEYNFKRNYEEINKFVEELFAILADKP